MAYFLDLDIYMETFLQKKHYPDLEHWTAPGIIEYMLNAPYHSITERHLKALLDEQPLKYEMVQWLANKGYAPKYIAKILQVTPQYVSQSINKKQTKRPYHSDVLTKLRAENWGLL